MKIISKPYIILRRDWNARNPTDKMNYLSKINYLVIHHTTFNGDNKIGEYAKEAVLDIQKYHMSKKYDNQGNLIKNKWADIGYHYLISMDGQIFQGRDINFQGAHAYGLNDKSIGIALLGNFSHKELYPSQMRSLVHLLALLKQKYSTPSTNIIGHRDVINLNPDGTITECPGIALYSQLSMIRSSVENLLSS
ncbi:peptidoglycan recognition family protein [Oceanirhabdus seepicola]|uniref:N-acetylmuramoyl-L-alanine amidase n=1 Tax=Oceanirhabdus seepicola TaxID=2828781 RepID=A0A9J6P5F5_9CLOT|nr:peptidoglycan recognition family protein [Oceanirhabdus seepicola]MCM1990760.1 N-acetylmuramoyl-L-alanine amidase [Oceanirhabdus seepicola]